MAQRILRGRVNDRKVQDNAPIVHGQSVFNV